MTHAQAQILESLGVDISDKKIMELNKDWLCYSLNHDKPTNDVPIILIERGPKNIVEIKKHIKNFDDCVVLFTERNILFLKASDKSSTVILENEIESARISSILTSCRIADAVTELQMGMRLADAINAIPNATRDFDNRGIFSNHYLRNRIFDDIDKNINIDINKLKTKINDTAKIILDELGWKYSNSTNVYYEEEAAIIVTNKNDFSIREQNLDISPSYRAISELRKNKWVILTNGKKWRLYTNKISASSTNYFEINLDVKREITIKYLLIIFGASSYKQKNGKRDIDRIFDESKNFATDIEENLSTTIMNADGVFLDIVKGVLDHDRTQIFTAEELENAKQISLKIMYRIWFLAYAESRVLLPIKDEKYKPISLRSIHMHLDSYESDLNNKECWSRLLTLFEGIRKGNVEHNLPQYNGELFKYMQSIDGISVKNKFITRALRGLLEKDGETIDYANLSVRHLGNIFETLMEFGVRQAEKDMMLLETKGGVKEVNTIQKSSYSYKKNDLYLASKGGIELRKKSASYYTPDKIVEFLVGCGLEPIFSEREKFIKDDLKKFKKTKSYVDRKICIDRLLDIQVLDPTMGSGHFLVESLNRITLWVTNMLNTYPEHPLLNEIEHDRCAVLAEQKKNGITIDETLLTHDVLLKRKIMKRSIFGVDINPMAVEITKLSLWLDSFAIGVPLTYMDHHIKLGDATIGMFLNDLKNKEMQTLDDWSPDAKSDQMISDVICSSDVTVDQVHLSEDTHKEYNKSIEPTKQILDALTASKIEPAILPKKGKNEFIFRFGRYSKNESKDFIQTQNIVNDLAQNHKFFHWELEMRDAFISQRPGFDLIVGNVPWEIVETNDEEFFAPYDTTFRLIKTRLERNKKVKEILKNPQINTLYKKTKKLSKGIGTFYKTYLMQGKEDKDMSLIVLERALSLIAKNGIISTVLPSQILTNKGSISIRKHFLEKDILSLYVFENRKKIFPIHSSWRFALFSARNKVGKNQFPAGFYLHNLSSLLDNNIEKEKFYKLSKQTIIDMSPDECRIPEVGGSQLEIIKKLFQNNDLRSKLSDGLNIEFVRGFNQAYDAYLLLDNGKGCSVLKGRNIHQYIHNYSTSEFTVNKRIGLKHEGRKKIFAGHHTDFYNSYRLAIRSISGPTNTRTVIATIIPPNTFHTEALRPILLHRNGIIILDINYIKKITYLCGVFNSLTFDFVSRSSTQTNLFPIIKVLPIPKPIHEPRIIELVAKILVGNSEFKEFSELLRIPNIKLTPAQRIENIAEIDALVAHSYNLTVKEYKTVIDSFKLFKKNPTLYDLEEVTWDNKNLKEFYGEMSDLALQYFKEIIERRRRL